MTHAQNVLDWISWIEHCLYVTTVCDGPYTAITSFNAFRMSRSAERGSHTPIAYVVASGDPTILEAPAARMPEPALMRWA